MESRTEGLANFLVYDDVFFNTKMRSLRDISVMFLRALNRKGTVLDTTSATGVRGIRYCLEASIDKAIFLDINKNAYENTKRNVELNRIDGTVLNEDIRSFSCKSNERFSAIDLDPFGTPVPYMKDLLSIGRDGTLYMVTATDTAVLCGAHANACMREYAARPLHNELCHEVGIRILIAYAVRLAAELNFGVHVYLALSNLHYMRIFFELKRGSTNALDSVRQIGFGSYCNKCHRYYYAPGIASAPAQVCESCGGRTERFGPLWLGSIYDKGVIAAMLSHSSGASDEAISLLYKVYNELDIPFFYSIPKLTAMLGVGSISQNVMVKELSKKGAASLTHFDPSGIKTDVPYDDIISELKNHVTTKAMR